MKVAGSRAYCRAVLMATSSYTQCVEETEYGNSKRFVVLFACKPASHQLFASPVVLLRSMPTGLSLILIQWVATMAATRHAIEFPAWAAETA